MVYAFTKSSAVSFFLLFLGGVFIPNDILDVFLGLWYMFSLYLDFSHTKKQKKTTNQKNLTQVPKIMKPKPKFLVGCQPNFWDQLLWVIFFF